MSWCGLLCFAFLLLAFVCLLLCLFLVVVFAMFLVGCLFAGVVCVFVVTVWRLPALPRVHKGFASLSRFQV